MPFISKNTYLSQSEQEDNALLIFGYFYSRGWSVNAIAGMLGNMESESTINPGIWESLTTDPEAFKREEERYPGFGLVQWTPYTNYTNWADSKGYEWTDGIGQCEWINEQTAPAGQWIPTDSYPLSWEEFKISSESVEYLASAFLKNFERADVEVEPERRSQAKKWYTFLTGSEPPEPPTPSTRKRKKYNFLLFKKRRYIV